MDNIDPRIDTLIDAYIDYSTDDAQFETLCNWLREDAGRRQIFARRLATHSAIAEWCTEQSGGELAGSLDNVEAELEVPTIQYTVSSNPSQSHYVSALSYVVCHTFTSKRFAMFAAAAAVLLAAVLTIVSLTSGPEEPKPFAEAPVPPGSSEKPINEPVVVATLTTERDAVWERRPGEDLYAGQRLTLTEGFAEITTKRGAVAIIEAPATIKFINNDNALRLHAGKLFGICETESSKGFLVRTPHLDITDLGTRFGVQVDPKGQTAADVFEGSIRIQTSDADESFVLNTDQGVVKEPDTPSQRYSTPNLAGDYQKMLTMFDGTPALTGDGVYFRKAPADVSLSKLRSDEAIIVFNEQAGLAWSSKLLPSERVGQGPAKDQRVDTYLLHFDPPIIDIKGGKVKQFERQVVIDFGRPILGVISDGIRLYESDTTLGSKTTRYPVMSDQEDQSSRGLDASKNSVPDGYSLSKDRQRLNAKMTAGRYFDQIRVIVEAASPE